MALAWINTSLAAGPTPGLDPAEPRSLCGGGVTDR
jgi:hypothetical protein